MKELFLEERASRSMRVRYLRELTELSRREFAKKFGIAAGTLQNWEDRKGNGLSEKGARRLTRVINNIGISCNVEWLFYGTGEAPCINNPILSDSSNSPSVQSQGNFIAKEVEFFCSLYKETISFQVKDDAMSPFYNENEFVAGIRYYGKSIELCLGADCIVQIETGEQILRRLKKNSIPGLYSLIPLNVNSGIRKLFFENVELVYAAPIIWIRRTIII